MESMVQNYLDVDFCDCCGAQIKEGEMVYLDVKSEYAGVIPAYCSGCVEDEDQSPNQKVIKS